MLLFPLLIFYYSYVVSGSKPLSSIQKFSQRSFSKSFHDIKGFDYTRTEQGQHIFRITADRVKIEKAKIGLFRFGLMKQVVFDNAKIKVIQADNKKKEGMISVIDATSTLPDFNAKRSPRIIFKPVEVRILSRAGKLMTMITAGSAWFDIPKQQVEFKDNVKITSESATLLTSTFRVVSKSGNAVVLDGYHLITPEKNLKGNSLLTDIFLTTFNDIIKEDP